MRILSVLFFLSVCPASALAEHPPLRPKHAEDLLLESHIAARLILGNLQEISLGNYVLDRVDEEDLEDLAKKMVKKLSKFNVDLERFAPHATAVSLSDEDHDHQSRRNSPARRARVRQQANRSSLERRLFTLERRAAKQSVSLLEEEWDDKNADELATAYLTHLIGSRIARLSQLTAAERSASRELKQHIRRAKIATEDHLEEVKNLLETLEGDDDD